jgi:hypothetical protein
MNRIERIEGGERENERRMVDTWQTISGVELENFEEIGR